ncbi:YvcK family protein [Candidatus Dojkabacteria bacterium]|uniref:Putative gluconeogenesis factor n=1 Tax=Candidatus Dojkabacteria bacterium TaxID=2099670 RepID=A0A955L4P4_9BACT|nr:YvcK family protein [Candidatus Dojkabacteria bacterium]
MNKVKVTHIGGGTGSISVLSGLKIYDDLDLSVVVQMSDDGGTAKVIRDEFGLLPFNDVRKSIIALAGSGNGKFRELFTYRFHQGEGLTDHTVGNLIMMAMSDITGSEKEAINFVSKLFDCKGNLYPVTFEQAVLIAEYENGDVVKGEQYIDVPEVDRKERIKNLYLEPNVKANEDAIKAILEAEYITIGPGDLYTSVLANVVVDGIAQAIKDSKAKIIFITNLMTENGETRGMTASDTVNEIEKYTGRRPDYVVVNNGEIESNIIEWYKKSGESPIQDDIDDDKYTEVVREDIISKERVKKVKGDSLARSLVRHDAQKLGRLLYKLITY